MYTLAKGIAKHASQQLSSRLNASSQPTGWPAPDWDIPGNAEVDLQASLGSWQLQLIV